MQANTRKTILGFLLAACERLTGISFKPRTLENIYNYIPVSDSISTSGQPDAAELKLIFEAGFTHVINLAPASILENSLKSEAQVLADLELDYTHIPVDFKAPSKQNFDDFVALMHATADQNVWVHCAANMRVSVFIYCYQVVVIGENADVAKARMDRIWEPSGVWKKFIAERLYSDPKKDEIAEAEISELTDDETIGETDHQNLHSVTGLKHQLNSDSSPDLLVQLMAWFKTELDIGTWGGPEFRFPFTVESFTADAQLEELLTVCLIDDAGQLVAFGQCYNRLDCCHLARLAIAPSLRGRGLVMPLIQALANEARAEFSFSELSLFVLKSNEGARQAYEKQGFRYVDYPAEMPHSDNWQDILYMRKAL